MVFNSSKDFNYGAKIQKSLHICKGKGDFLQTCKEILKFIAFNLPNPSLSRMNTGLSLGR